jgi:hypothetical protein
MPDPGVLPPGPTRHSAVARVQRVRSLPRTKGSVKHPDTINDSSSPKSIQMVLNLLPVLTSLDRGSDSSDVAWRAGLTLVADRTTCYGSSPPRFEVDVQAKRLVTSPDLLPSRVQIALFLMQRRVDAGLVMTQWLGRAKEAFGAAGGEVDAEQERERREKRAALGPGSAAGGPPLTGLPGSR